jgi:hypothetical protein
MKPNAVDTYLCVVDTPNVYLFRQLLLVDTPNVCPPMAVV